MTTQPTTPTTDMGISDGLIETCEHGTPASSECGECEADIPTDDICSETGDYRCENCCSCAYCKPPILTEESTAADWFHIRRPFRTAYTSGHLERYTARLDGATLTIFHRAATVEDSRKWDVSIKVNGQGYDRIFGGQPVHDSPSLAKEWVLDNITKIRAVVATTTTPQENS